jgi:hypothetical protein
MYCEKDRCAWEIQIKNGCIYLVIHFVWFRYLLEKPPKKCSSYKFINCCCMGGIGIRTMHLVANWGCAGQCMRARREWQGGRYVVQTREMGDRGGFLEEVVEVGAIVVTVESTGLFFYRTIQALQESQSKCWLRWWYNRWRGWLWELVKYRGERGWHTREHRSHHLSILWTQYRVPQAGQHFHVETIQLVVPWPICYQYKVSFKWETGTNRLCIETSMSDRFESCLELHFDDKMRYSDC